MSFQAMAWASGTKDAPMIWGSPSARATIYAVANHANDEWFCWAKQSTLAAESEQSPDSIQRRIQEFVAMGRVRRIKLKRFGRRTNDFLILKPSPYFDAPIEQIEPFLPRGCDIMSEDLMAADCGSVESQEDAMAQEDSEINDAADIGSDKNATLPQSAVDAAALVRQQEPITEPRLPTQTLPELQDPKASQPKEDAAAASITAWISEFRETYPLPCSSPERFAEEVARLDDEHRSQAMRGARGTRQFLRKNPKAKGIVGPLRYIRSSALWAEFARFVPPEKAPSAPHVFAAIGDDQWNARAVLMAIIGREMPTPKPCGPNGEIGATFVGELPHAGLLLARFADQHGHVSTEDWAILDHEQPRDRQRIGAWCERVRECLGINLEASNIRLQGTIKKEVLGKTYSIPNSVKGLRVPRNPDNDDFPPPKGDHENHAQRVA